MAAPRKKSAQSTVSVPSGDVSSDAAPSASAPSASVPSTAISSAVFSRQQLEKAPERVFRFLMALGRYPVIMRHLEEVGYSPKDHQDGWDLLHQLSAYNQPKSTPSASSYKEALASLDRWDEPNFRRASAALQFRYPEQHAFLFHDLKAEQGERAVLSVQTFLDRVEALEHASRPERKASAKQDKEAVQLLYQRKILSSESLQQLRAWLHTAKSSPQTDHLVDAETLQAKQDKWLGQIAQWFAEWSQTARAANLRRTHLISLGLAKRRTNSSPPSDDSDDSDDDTNDSPTLPNTQPS